MALSGRQETRLRRDELRIPRAPTAWNALIVKSWCDCNSLALSARTWFAKLLRVGIEDFVLTLHRARGSLDLYCLIHQNRRSGSQAGDARWGHRRPRGSLLHIAEHELNCLPGCRYDGEYSSRAFGRARRDRPAAPACRSRAAAYQLRRALTSAWRRSLRR